jgi:hypothetical protein
MVDGSQQLSVALCLSARFMITEMFSSGYFHNSDGSEDSMIWSSASLNGSRVFAPTGILSRSCSGFSDTSMAADILFSVCFGLSGEPEETDILSSDDLTISDAVKNSGGLVGSLSCVVPSGSPVVACFDLSDRLVFSNYRELLDTATARDSHPFEGSESVAETQASLRESQDFTMSDLVTFSNRSGLQGIASANADAFGIPSSCLQESVSFKISRVLAPAVRKPSDVFYPSPFLSELSPPAVQAASGFTILEMSGTGVGLLIFLSLLVLMSIRYCRKRWMAVASVNRSLEYSDRDSDEPSDKRTLEFGREVGKSIGKSIWSESESESDGPSI